ncbi:HAD-IC family P-type ATPase [Patescibacteria group bacterium]|nr:HAD-IC family P-type ATPase [Patescibacteria group bacterium]MBU1758524.1 HAD-IC family P-type ATPase [Patescibacteria group bacterium]
MNDAPALKRADVGVAMAIKGTDVARDSADIVLVDDNFASIVNAIEYGRIMYDNIKKFVKLLLSANFDEILVISIAILVGLPLPMLPVQILRINLMTDSMPAIAL